MQPHFTPRERKILSLVAADLSDKEISRVLNLSPRTVQAHMSRLFLRYGLHHRPAVVAFWLRSQG